MTEGEKVELNKIYNMDCMDGMKKLLELNGEGWVDLIITSPPYNLGGSFHTGNNRMKAYDTHDDNLPEDEYQKNQVEVLNLCHKLLKENGSMFYNHKPRIKQGISIHPLEWVLDSDFILKQEIIWRNGSQNFDKIRFYPMTERIYWLAKNSETKLYNEIGFSDVWEFKNAKRHKEHNATFPIDLPLSIISCFEDSQTIFDPYMGIGTTAIASAKMKKDYIGFELSEKYYETSLKRIEEETAQANIFDFI